MCALFLMQEELHIHLGIYKERKQNAAAQITESFLKQTTLNGAAEKLCVKILTEKGIKRMRTNISIR